MKSKVKKQQKKQPKKQKLTFQQRFKDKKNVVGKAGLIEILDMHQPFSLDKKIILKNQIHNQKHDKPHQIVNWNDTSKQKPKSVMDNHEIEKYEEQLNLKSYNKTKASTPAYKARKFKSREQDIQSAKLRLPKISQSTQNLTTLSQRQRPQTQIGNYWNQSLGKKGLRKRRANQLSCLNLIKRDNYANQQWEALNKFTKLCIIKRNKERREMKNNGNDNNYNSNKNVKQYVQNLEQKVKRKDNNLKLINPQNCTE